MDITISKRTFFVFDLDDTLYQEIDFLKSAYRFISKQVEGILRISVYDEMMSRYQRKENVFGWILETYGRELEGWERATLLQMYREHTPEISVSEGTRDFLEAVKQRQIPAGLITDGRSVTQRNKLKVLGIEELFCDIIISEEFGSGKPDEKNYLFFSDKYPGRDFYYFGDNTTKDFIAPKRLGWTTVCLRDQGFHIHPQHPEIDKAADYVIDSFEDVRLF
jgi:putative hydrolase of the HAD superfamily